MEKDTFREEFISSRQLGDFGATIVSPQRATRIAAIAALIGMSALLTMLGVLPYKRVISLSGMLVPDGESFVVTSPLKDVTVVEKILVRNGEPVLPGSPLLILSGPKNLLEQTAGFVSNARIGAPSIVKDPKNRKNDRAVVVVSSTHAGYIDRYLVGPGDMVASGQSILLINRSQDELLFQTMIDDAHVAAIRQGQRVYLRLDAFPHHRYGVIEGHVSEISERSYTPLQVSSMLGMPPPARAQFMVRIAVDGAEEKQIRRMKIGMSGATDVPVEETSILRWMLRSFFNRKASWSREDR